MNPSPSKLLEEYKMKWTCKVNAGIFFLHNSNPGHFKVCLVAEVEVILQPCGHLCLCEPCSLSIRRRFFFASISLIYFSENALDSICNFCEVYILPSLRSHFLANRVRDLMFGEPVPRTPCPICRFTNSSSACQLKIQATSFP